MTLFVRNINTKLFIKILRIIKLGEEKYSKYFLKRFYDLSIYTNCSVCEA